jgi:hypothetical protein
MRLVNASHVDESLWPHPVLGAATFLVGGAMVEFYVKVHKSMLLSSIWDEDHLTRITWVTLLMMSDQNGYVGASVTGIAHMARITVEEATVALGRLMSPDPNSRSKTNEGRRVVEHERGYLLVNYTAIMEGSDEVARKASQRAASRKHRTQHDEASQSNELLVSRNAIKSDQDQSTDVVLQATRAKTVQKPDEVRDDVWVEWCALRKAHRAPITPTVLSMLMREGTKAGMGLQAVLELCLLRGWRGFQADWVRKSSNTEPSKPSANNASAKRFIEPDGSPTVGDLQGYMQSKETR